MTQQLPRRLRPGLERLETRAVPAAITTDLRGGVLTVLGTSDPDVVGVNQVGGLMYVQGTTTTYGVPTTITRAYTAAAVRTVVVDLGSSNDRVIVAPSVAQPARLY